MLKFVQSKLSVFRAVAEGRITICWTQQTHTECMGYTTISHQPEDFQVGEKVVCLIHKQKSCKLLTARQRDAISFKTKFNFMVLIEEKPTHMVLNLQSLSSWKASLPPLSPQNTSWDFRTDCPDSTYWWVCRFPLQRGVETSLWHKELAILLSFTCSSPKVWQSCVYFTGLLLNICLTYIRQFYLAVLTRMETNSISNQVNGSLALGLMLIKSSP